MGWFHCNAGKPGDAFSKQNIDADGWLKGWSVKFESSRMLNVVSVMLG